MSRHVLKGLICCILCHSSTRERLLTSSFLAYCHSLPHSCGCIHELNSDFIIMLVPSLTLYQKWVTVLLSPVCVSGLYVHMESLHTADEAERQTLCVVHRVHIQSLCVCDRSDCGMCSHLQTNNGSLAATTVRERIGLRGIRGGERLLVYGVSLWYGAPIWSLWILHHLCHTGV